MSLYLRHEDEKIKTGGAASCYERKTCFYCNEMVAYPRIMWMGNNDIWMHPNCARSLCTRMLRDVWEWENATGADR